MCLCVICYFSLVLYRLIFSLVCLMFYALLLWFYERLFSRSVICYVFVPAVRVFFILYLVFTLGELQLEISLFVCEIGNDYI